MRVSLILLSAHYWPFLTSLNQVSLISLLWEKKIACGVYNVNSCTCILDEIIRTFFICLFVLNIYCLFYALVVLVILVLLVLNKKICLTAYRINKIKLWTQVKSYWKVLSIIQILNLKHICLYNTKLRQALVCICIYLFV